MSSTIIAQLSILFATCALLLALAQLVKVRCLSRCHFGILAPAALRWQLWLWSLLRRRCAIVAFDVRKLHDCNEVFGYSTMNDLVGDLVRVRLRPGRHADIIGQYGGDEFVAIVADPAAGALVVARLIERMTTISAQMPPEQRAVLACRTGGLIGGLCAAIALVPETRDAAAAARQAIDAAGRIKAGAVTGSRSTSGAAGTQFVVVGGL